MKNDTLLGLSDGTVPVSLDGRSNKDQAVIKPPRTIGSCLREMSQLLYLMGQEWDRAGDTPEYQRLQGIYGRVKTARRKLLRELAAE